jgi:hypothetical protein
MKSVEGEDQSRWNLMERLSAVISSTFTLIHGTFMI